MTHCLWDMEQRLQKLVGCSQQYSRGTAWFWYGGFCDTIWFTRRSANWEMDETNDEILRKMVLEGEDIWSQEGASSTKYLYGHTEYSKSKWLFLNKDDRSSWVQRHLHSTCLAIVLYIRTNPGKDSVFVFARSLPLDCCHDFLVAWRCRDDSRHFCASVFHPA